MSSNYRTKFQDNWLSKIDCNEMVVSRWASKVSTDSYSCFCNICSSKVSIEKGFEKLNQHAKTQKHQSNLYKIKENQAQLSFQSASTLTVAHESENSQLSKTQNHPVNSKLRQKANNTITLFNPQDAATRAELYLCLDIVNSKNPTTACEGKKEGIK